ncbi:MAG: hypothetical protein JKX81_16690 [Arenicella sp.]|nr:hypothetical protein [Arenicella sp.]
MSVYQIIDEPQPSLYSKLVIDPVAILFASLLIPIFIELPLYGRFWMPLAWIVLNGWLLGSPTRKKETVIAIAGGLTLIIFYSAMVYLAGVNVEMATLAFPYYRILNQGALFFTLYMIVFYQSAPYAIHQYVKEHN